MQGDLIQGAVGFTSLDNNGHISISKVENGGKLRAREWSRKQKRGYQRVRSCLSYWLENDFKVLWLTLTSSPDSDFAKLNYNFQRLRQMIEKSKGFEGLQYYRVKTFEGYGVFHVLLAWKPAKGFRNNFWISQKWLSDKWDSIHKAHRVWIGKVYSERYLSKYIISQYVAEQNGYVNMSYSWRKTFGFPLVSVWYSFKQYCKDKGYNLYKAWAELLAGGVFAVGENKFLSLDTIKGFYTRWRSGDCWVTQWSWQRQKTLCIKKPFKNFSMVEMAA